MPCSFTVLGHGVRFPHAAMILCRFPHVMVAWFGLALPLPPPSASVRDRPLDRAPYPAGARLRRLPRSTMLALPLPTTRRPAMATRSLAEHGSSESAGSEVGEAPARRRGSSSSRRVAAAHHGRDLPPAWQAGPASGTFSFSTLSFFLLLLTELQSDRHGRRLLMRVRTFVRRQRDPKGRDVAPRTTQTAGSCRLRRQLGGSADAPDWTAQLTDLRGFLALAAGEGRCAQGFCVHCLSGAAPHGSGCTARVGRTSVSTAGCC